VPYVLVQHEPDVWLEARVEKQWRHQGRWRLSVYYYVDVGLQHYRVYDADQCRPAGSAAELQDEDRCYAAAGQEQPERHDEAARWLPPVVRVHARESSRQTEPRPFPGRPRH
jgi:hypothetical protein